MKPTEDYHKLQKCEYYQSEECDCLTECAAILKESTPSTETESQEELWLELMGILLAQYLSKGSMDYRETMKQFTITRKQ